MSDADTKLKMVLIIFLVAVLPAGVFFLLLSMHPPEDMASCVGLYLVAMIIVHVPLANFFSEILALRNIRKVNAYCDSAKQGQYRIAFQLPPEKGEEHDFLRMKRNLYWMGQIIAERETKLFQALRELKTAQRAIVESIEYASLIQHSVLPSESLLDSVFRDYCIWWEPRDVVGGDTYWVCKSREGYFVGVIDCTGHGVPGAFVTLIVHTLLERISESGDWNDPSKVLQSLNRRLKAFFARNHSLPLVDDGFEAGLCFVHTARNQMVFSGAGRPLLYSLDREIHEIRGDRSGVGYARIGEDREYRNHTIDLHGGMRFYLTSDGVTDQIGEITCLPLGKKRFKHLLAQTVSLPLGEQKQVLKKSLDAYAGKEDRRDDLTLFGFCIKE